MLLECVVSLYYHLSQWPTRQTNQKKMEITRKEQEATRAAAKAAMELADSAFRANPTSSLFALAMNARDAYRESIGRWSRGYAGDMNDKHYED